MLWANFLSVHRNSPHGYVKKQVQEYIGTFPALTSSAFLADRWADRGISSEDITPIRSKCDTLYQRKTTNALSAYSKRKEGDEFKTLRETL
jgi:hypothetical protein